MSQRTISSRITPATTMA